MGRVTQFGERLLTSLKRLPVEDASIRVYPTEPGTYRYVGDVVTKSFEGLHEGARQAIVWERLLADLDDDEQARVEFVFTDTPAERLAKSHG